MPMFNSVVIGKMLSEHRVVLDLYLKQRLQYVVIRHLFHRSERAFPHVAELLEVVVPHLEGG